MLDRKEKKIWFKIKKQRRNNYTGSGTTSRYLTQRDTRGRKLQQIIQDKPKAETEARNWDLIYLKVWQTRIIRIINKNNDKSSRHENAGPWHAVFKTAEKLSLIVLQFLKHHPKPVAGHVNLQSFTHYVCRQHFIHTILFQFK